MSDEPIEAVAARYAADPCFQCEITGCEATVRMLAIRRRNEERLVAWAVAELDRRKGYVMVKREVLEEIINAFGDYGLGAWNYAACQLLVSKLVVALGEKP